MDMHINTIETPRLQIRELTKEDVNDVLEILGDKETANMGGINPFETRDDAIDFIQRDYPGCQNVGIVKKDHPEEVIGLIEIYPAEHLFGEGNRKDSTCIGYYTKKTQRGKGIMPEAVSSLKEVLFETGVAQLLIGIFPENASSRRVLEKCGLNRDCYMEEFLFTEYGTLEDVEFFSESNPCLLAS